MARFTSEPLRGSVLHDGLVVGEAEQPGAGLGLRATSSFSEGAPVYRERARVFVQSRFSARAAPACLECGRLVGGGLEEVLEQVLRSCEGTRVRLKSPAAAQEYPTSLAGYPHLRKSDLLGDRTRRSTCPGPPAELRSPLRAAWRTALPPCVSCPAGCGAAFCSDSCMDEQLQGGHHRVLCAERSAAQRSAWREFREHAQRHSETLLLAALVVAQAICDVLYGGRSLDEVAASYVQFYAQSWPEKVSEDVAERHVWVRKRWAVLEASHALLLDVLGDCAPPGLADMVSLSGFALVAGMIELVSKDLERRNPLDAPLKDVLEALPMRAKTELRKITLLWMTARADAQEAEEPTSPEDSEDEETASCCRNSKGAPDAERVASLAVLPVFEGFGLVRSVAVTNHSCAPNVEVEVSGETADVVALALGAISAGEELTMSYIDEGMPRAARQRLLRRSYGFHCHCPRCEEEGGPPGEPARPSACRDGARCSDVAAPDSRHHGEQGAPGELARASTCRAGAAAEGLADAGGEERERRPASRRGAGAGRAGSAEDGPESVGPP
uniref:SET domain-containing protein n=1 Tax=Alexandrium monilatum TaxID=311494 RepID=A0A7S4UNW9_9DINO